MDPVAVETVAQTGHISLWHLVMQASWVVKLVMLGLALSSVWSWAIIIEKFFAMRKMNAANDRFEQNFWSGQSLEDLYISLGNRPTVGPGGHLHGGHARVEAQPGSGHAGRLPRRPEAHREGDGRADPEGDARRRGAPAVPGDHRLGRALHRPFRHGLGHHGLASRPSPTRRIPILRWWRPASPRRSLPRPSASLLPYRRQSSTTCSPPTRAASARGWRISPMNSRRSSRGNWTSGYSDGCFDRRIGGRLPAAQLQAPGCRPRRHAARST